jgi:hypothetical protein
MSKTFQTLTVNAMTGNTYWQKAQDSVEDAQSHAFRYARNRADFFIYEISGKDTIRLIKTITHRGV